MPVHCDNNFSETALISEVTTTLRTSSYSPIMTVMFFMTHVDSRPEMKMSSELCKTSYERRQLHADCRIDYMQSGLLR